jgi:hypothetical protein
MINKDLVEYSVGCLRPGAWWVPAILCTNVDDATSSGICAHTGQLKASPVAIQGIQRSTGQILRGHRTYNKTSQISQSSKPWRDQDSEGKSTGKDEVTVTMTGILQHNVGPKVVGPAGRVATGTCEGW